MKRSYRGPSKPALWEQIIEICRGRSSSIPLNEKLKILQVNKFTHCALIAEEQTMLKDYWYKNKPSLKCSFCNNLDHSEKFCRAKKRQPRQLIEQHAKVSEEEKEEDEHLFMASQNGPSSRACSLHLLHPE